MRIRNIVPVALLAGLLCGGMGTAGAAQKASAGGKSQSGQSAQSAQAAKQANRNSVLPSSVRK